MEKANGVKLKKAIEEFGSLEKAVQALRKEKLSLEKSNAQLEQQNAELKLNRDGLFAEVQSLYGKLGGQKKELNSLLNEVKKYGHQQELFEGFLAMLLGSPSVTGSLQNLIQLFQELDNLGWRTTNNAEDSRSLFVRTVLGDYLKCFRCETCGASFIVNKEPKSSFLNYYHCPSCHFSNCVKADDSFIRSMVSEKQLEDVTLAGQLQEQLDVLKPFETFLNLPCEICGKPITEWTNESIKLGITGAGWGHQDCWNTPAGEILAATKALKMIREAQDKVGDNA